MAITDFRGEHDFLSNGYPCNILHENQVYPSVEHAFQAAKTNDLVEREKIRTAPDAPAAKVLGRAVSIAPDWDARRLTVMENLLRQKFELNLDLKIKLLMTGNQELVQGGMRGDTFWGKDKTGQGQNNLGLLMMKIRDEVRTAEGGALKVLETYLSGCGLGFLGEHLNRLLKLSRDCYDSSDADSLEFSDVIQSLE